MQPIPYIPDNAPFTPEQRSWLNGLLAGLFSVAPATPVAVPATASLKIAVLYASQGNYDKAKSALELAIHTHPSYATAHENLGDIYAQLASRAYDRALQLDKNNTTAQVKLAMVKDLFSSQKVHAFIRPMNPSEPYGETRASTRAAALSDPINSRCRRSPVVTVYPARR